MDIVLNLWTAFSNAAISIILMLSMNEHKRPFHLLLFSSISSFNVFKFSVWSSYC